jgi:spermidine synthase
LREDPRFRLDRGDIYEQLLQGPGAKHDLILIDVDHSPDEQLGTTSGRFYAEEGLRAASEHLTPGGILAVWSYAESSALADALGSVFHEVRVEPVWFHNDLIDETETDWLFLARR